MKTETSKKINRSVLSEASLTVESSLVLPLFLFFFIGFLYFMQLIMVQEELQKAITETGLHMARSAYILSDFYNIQDAAEADTTMLEQELRDGFTELIGAAVNNLILKNAVGAKLNKEGIISSLIIGGFDGICFDDSKLLNGSNDIDIVIKYRIRFPLSVFGSMGMNMIQRVKLRAWNGDRIAPLYTIIEENNNAETIVYITESGSVYHLRKDCSHISLSVQTVTGKPTWQRNNSGGKYYPCEACCKSNGSDADVYYITSYGDRYHIIKNCSKIKRNVKEIPISEVGDRPPCKRCGK
ncbi:MAG: hypothetical protein GX059_07735 [Clostridiales bacterium]|nr:hypothetical protein [Clostridiales bacterium]